MSIDMLKIVPDSMSFRKYFITEVGLNIYSDTYIVYLSFIRAFNCIYASGYNELQARNNTILSTCGIIQMTLKVMSHLQVLSTVS